MKIAICVPLNLNNPGGLEKHVLRLADALRHLDAHVDVFAACKSDSQESFLPLSSIKPHQYDIIHTHSGFLNPQLLNLRFQRLPRQRWVHTLHNISLEYLFACRAWLNWRSYLCSATEAFWSQYADHVIAVSHSVARWTRDIYRVPPKKISVIHNGFSPEHRPDENNRNTLRRELGVSDDHFLLLFVGRGEDPVKGTDRITAALNQLYRDHPHIRLLALPGSGFSDAPWLIRPGSIPHQKMLPFYQAADLFINASLTEGFPLTVVEAMACNCPVLAAPVGGIPEIITHNQTGMLLQPNRADLPEKIHFLMNHPQLRKTLAQNAKLTAENQLTWPHLAQQTLRLYQSLR